MLQVDASLFANVATTIQRTSSLTGGAVQGLPGGVVLTGLQGVSSFGSDITEAQKEFELGRVRNSLERIKQIEMQFNGIVGRWNAQAGGVVSSARQGQQKLSIQKLNEVKSAQTKMQQLTGPAVKAFRDLVSALEHAVTMEGHQKIESESETPEESETTAVADKVDRTQSSSKPDSLGKAHHPSNDLLGHFASNYTYGAKLAIVKNDQGKSTVSPSLQSDKFYLFAGMEPPRVIRVRELNQSSLIVFDTHLSAEALIDSKELRKQLKAGIWQLTDSK